MRWTGSIVPRHPPPARLQYHCVFCRLQLRHQSVCVLLQRHQCLWGHARRSPICLKAPTPLPLVSSSCQRLQPPHCPSTTDSATMKGCMERRCVYHQRSPVNCSKPVLSWYRPHSWNTRHPVAEEANPQQRCGWRERLASLSFRRSLNQCLRSCTVSAASSLLCPEWW